MADSSLDDFFAKKDKSKKKSKSKMSPADVLSGGDEVKKVKKKKAQEQSGGPGLSTTENTTRKEEDEEWKDFEEQKEVDYSGLRIQTLQIREEEEKEAADSDEQGEGEEGEEGREGASGPWNKSTGQPMPAAAAPPPPAPVPEPEEKKESSAPKKYVPPSLRNAAPASASPINPMRRGKKEAPNIKSEDDFPTLGGAPSGGQATSAWGARRYEDSSAGDIESNPGSRRGVNLSLENKYAALQD